jgi:hypothetical protein
MRLPPDQNKPPQSFPQPNSALVMSLCTGPNHTLLLRPPSHLSDFKIIQNHFALTINGVVYFHQFHFKY